MNALHLDPVKAALYLARRAHDGQRDKAGEPYVMHPLRVMRAMAPDDVAGRVVALLHDVIEDTPVTIPEIELFGFSREIVDAIDCLTRDRPYWRYLERIATNPLARRVNLADIADNADEARLALLRREEAQRLREKYAQARAYLEGAWTPPPEIAQCADAQEGTGGRRSRS